MKIVFDITYAEPYLPTPRHRKYRYNQKQTNIELEINQANPDKFKKAYKIITPTQENRTEEYDIYQYNGKYYHNIQNTKSEYIKNRIQYNPTTKKHHWHKQIIRWNEWNPDNNSENTLDIIIKELQEQLSDKIEYNNEIYIELKAPPTYEVINFNNENYVDIEIVFQKNNLSIYSDNIFYPNERYKLENYIKGIMKHIHKYRPQKLKRINNQLKKQIIAYPETEKLQRPKLQIDTTYYYTKSPSIHYKLNNKHNIKQEKYYNNKTHNIESAGYILYSTKPTYKILFGANTLEEIEEYINNHNM